jgi:hypothetical protein
VDAKGLAPHQHHVLASWAAAVWVKAQEASAWIRWRENQTKRFQYSSPLQVVHNLLFVVCADRIKKFAKVHNWHVYPLFLHSRWDLKKPYPCTLLLVVLNSRVVLVLGVLDNSEYTPTSTLGTTLTKIKTTPSTCTRSTKYCSRWVSTYNWRFTEFIDDGLKLNCTEPRSSQMNSLKRLVPGTRNISEREAWCCMSYYKHKWIKTVVLEYRTANYVLRFSVPVT